jgi:hypothetical protein
MALEAMVFPEADDQASIVDGAINYVRELEQLLQSLEVQKSIKNRAAGKSLFASFFSFPQYSTSSSHAGCSATGSSTTMTNGGGRNRGDDDGRPRKPQSAGTT